MSTYDKYYGWNSQSIGCGDLSLTGTGLLWLFGFNSCKMMIVYTISCITEQLLSIYPLTLTTYPLEGSGGLESISAEIGREVGEQPEEGASSSQGYIYHTGCKSRCSQKDYVLTLSFLVLLQNMCTAPPSGCLKNWRPFNSSSKTIWLVTLSNKSMSAH